VRFYSAFLQKFIFAHFGNMRSARRFAPMKANECSLQRRTNMKFRIASILALAIGFASAASAADAPTPNLYMVGSVSVTAARGDSITTAKTHHHEYVYVTHAADQSIEVIDVSNPTAPRQVSGKDEQRALSARPVSAMAPTAAYPDAISATSDGRKLIYVLDENSLRILSTKPVQDEQQRQDDGWFRNAQTPG
jgi:hypothetical protein